MAFIEENGTIISFAEYQDVLDRDQRLFDANEGLSDSIIESALIRATDRVLNKIRGSNWWVDYNLKRNNNQVFRTRLDAPLVDINKIIERKDDFTDLCVYVALSEYILPSIADFGSQDNAERKKMEYYVMKAETLFGELITYGDWYDFDDDGTVESNEKDLGYYNLRRVR